MINFLLGSALTLNLFLIWVLRAKDEELEKFKAIVKALMGDDAPPSEDDDDPYDLNRGPHDHWFI